MKKTLLVLLSVINQLFMTTITLAQFASSSEYGKTQFQFDAGESLNGSKDLIQDYETLVELTTGKDGLFCIQNLSGGKLHVSAMGEGYVAFVEFSKVISVSGSLSDITLPFPLISSRGLGRIQQNRVKPNSFVSDGRIDIIAGVLRNSETDVPIPNAKVVLRLSGEFNPNKTSRLSGQYDLLNIPQGDYDLFISHAGRDLKGQLIGVIRDKESGEPLPFTNVAVLKDGKVISGAATDFDGGYKIVDLNPGTYDLKVSSVGYTSEQHQINIKSSKISSADFKLQPGILLSEIVVEAFCCPLIEKDGSCCKKTVTGRDILNICGRGNSCCRRVTTMVLEDSLEAEKPKLLEVEPSVSIFPNPASSLINLELHDLKEEPLSLRILDSSGRIVLEQKQLPLSRLSIALDGLSDGVYFASVQLKDKFLTERFVVAR